MKTRFVLGILLVVATFMSGCAQTSPSAANRPAAKTQRKTYIARNAPLGSHIPQASSYDVDAPNSNIDRMNTDQITRMSDMNSARFGGGAGAGGGR